MVRGIPLGAFSPSPEFTHFLSKRFYNLRRDFLSLEPPLFTVFFLTNETLDCCFDSGLACCEEPVICMFLT